MSSASRKSKAVRCWTALALLCVASGAQSFACFAPSRLPEGRWGRSSEAPLALKRRSSLQSGSQTVAAATATEVPSLSVVALQGLALLASMTGAIGAILGAQAALKGFIGILGLYVIMSFNEYAVHRWYQHLGINKTPLHRWLREAFSLKPMKSSGHVEHHAETLDDMSLDMQPNQILDRDPFRGTAFSWSVSATMTLEIAMQSYPFLWRCGWSVTASTTALALAILLHAAVWQTLHPAMHGLPDPAMKYGVPGWSLARFRQTRYFRFLYANHEGHHRTPGAHGNYNVCFPLADHIFGTNKGVVPAAA